MDRRLPRMLIASWLVVGAVGYVAVGRALDGRSTGVTWTLAVEAAVAWTAVWVATMIPRITTLTVARIGVPAAFATAVACGIAGGSTIWSIALAVAGLAALGALAHPITIDAFVDGSSYGPEQRFALRTPALTALAATPPTWAFTVAIALAPPLAVTGNLVAALVVGIVWVVGFRFTVRSLHLPARRWVVFVPAGMVLSDPLVLVDRVLFPRRNVAAIGPAYSGTDATDLARGATGLALQLDLTEPFAIPMTDGSTTGERTVTTDRLVFAVLRPGALLTAATAHRFTVGETSPTEPQCVHHAHDDHGAVEPEVSQTAVPLPRTRSSR